MKKIFFCILLCIIATLVKAQKPPVRTSDPVPAQTRVAATLPLKSGGAAPAGKAAQVQGAPNATLGQVQGAPHPAFDRVNPGSTRPLLPSEMPVKKDAQKQ